MKKLLALAGALPFILVVFLNTVVDLGHKIVIQNTIFKVYDGPEQVYLTAIVNGLILLPFILMFSAAGYIADKHPKTSVMKSAAWAAVVLTGAITLCYQQGWFWAAFAMTFLLAVQSAFYSPAKYSYIKLLFGKQHLAEANGILQAVAIIGILSGTLLFSLMFEAWYPQGMLHKNGIIQGLTPVGWLLVLTSVAELILMYRLPVLETVRDEQRFDFKAYARGRMARENLMPVLKRRELFLPIVGLAVFWSIGQVMFAAFPAFAKAQNGETNTVVIQAILAASGIGIALGSMIAARVSRDYIETGLVPVGAAGIALGLILLPGLNSGWWMALDFIFIGCMGGLLIVPLNALVQFHAGDEKIGRVMAANNLIQNVAMLSFLIVTVLLADAGFSGASLLGMTAVVALVGFGYTVYQLPQSLIRVLLGYLISMRYRVRVEGMKHIPSEGGVLLLGNHISWLDWAIVQLACPRAVRFVMIRSIYERWYLNWFFRLFGTIPIEQGAASKQALEKVTELLNAGEVVCLFPEGTISRSGHLAEFRRGYEKAAQAAVDSVKIVPFYLHGLWGSQFSRSSAQLKAMRKAGPRRDLWVAFGPELPRDTPAEHLKQRIFDLSITAWRRAGEDQPTLADTWISSAKRMGGEMAIADSLSPALSGHRALAGAILLSRRVHKLCRAQNVGLLLPISSVAVVANMAALLAGKTLVNLNYTASSEAFAASLQQAGITTVFTSQHFLDKLARCGIDLSSVLDSVELVLLEEVKEAIPKSEALFTLLAVRVLPAWLLKWLYSRNHDCERTAAIMFSSGSEGLPKGVQLSHRNIMANAKQVAEVLNAEGDDVIMASLPLFHAFGLTVGQFMPLIEGLPMVCHADPTDGFGVAKAVARYRATILFGTSTFLRLYARDNKVTPLMFDSLRLVVSGAERLNPQVREAFKLKFGKDIYEGYGATETAPVASVNLPNVLDTSRWKEQLGHRDGTVGMPLPGTSFRVVDPASFKELETGEDGMILIGGPQVMLGYLNNAEKTAEVIREIDGQRWYVSGDKGHVDADGFLTVVDRYSRFAKLGGEMVSLGAVENAVRQSLAQDDVEVVAINLPDAKKGERVVLLSEHGLDLKALKQTMLEAGFPALWIPAEAQQIDNLPRLGSGKTDFAAAKRFLTG